MRNIFLLVGKDFKRKWKNPVVIIGFMLIPVVFTFIFGLVFGGDEEETLPRITVLVADNDKSLLSSFLTTAMAQGELKKMVELKPMKTEKEARDLLRKGKASALLIIPENFGGDILDGKKAEVLLLKNPSEQFLPQIAEEITDTTTLILSALLSVFSEEVDKIKEFTELDQLADADISAFSVKVKNRIESISTYVFPPVIGLKQRTIKEEKKEETGSISVHSYILPAMAIMFLMFICNVVFNDILREKETKTLLRLNASRMSLIEFIWSKIVTSALIGMLCTLVLIGCGIALFSIGWGNFVAVFLIVLCLNILIAGFIAFLYSFIKTELQAGAVLSSVILIMSLLGGSMIPIENFPSFIKPISKVTLNYWGLEAFRMAMMKEPIVKLIPILAGMVLAGILLSFISSRFIQNNLKKGLVK
ncbi:MAG: ABC transporter permease [Candidatus Aminicenantes bacterium]